MKINPIMNPNILQTYRANTVKPAKTQSVESGTDEVSFSENAVSFSKVMAALKEDTRTRSVEEQARFDAIASAVRGGTYKIDSDKVAEKIMSSLLPGASDE
jgi:flagellar biosynthesis anti-sigma factor FlgM